LNPVKTLRMRMTSGVVRNPQISDELLMKRTAFLNQRIHSFTDRACSGLV